MLIPFASGQLSAHAHWFLRPLALASALSVQLVGLCAGWKGLKKGDAVYLGMPGGFLPGPT